VDEAALFRSENESADLRENATGLWQKTADVLSLLLSVLSTFSHNGLMLNNLEARGVEPLSEVTARQPEGLRTL
jgi:hypothetical protein